jgi:molybdopterin adenylyltransferase
MNHDPIKIGLLSISDRASAGVYEDKGLPALEEWLRSALKNPILIVSRVIADDQALIESTLIEFVDQDNCALVLTTGGTGPAPRDVTPEATVAIADRIMEGFGERMRQISLRFVGPASSSTCQGSLKACAKRLKDFVMKRENWLSLVCSPLFPTVSI